MTYEIKYSAASIIDMNAILEYITVELCNESAANKIIANIMKSIDLLALTPYMHKTIDSISWRGNSLRMYTKKNYSITYFVDEKGKLVRIARVIYSKRNIIDILNENRWAK